MSSRLVPAEGPYLDQILAATYDIWNEGLSRDAYARWWQGQLGTAWGRTRLRRFALADGDRVLASAKRYAFEAVLDGRPIRVIGIGAVFTQPAVRGRGHARDLIERLLDQASSDGADLALLFSEIGDGYYTRLGFETIPAKECALQIAESSAHGAPAMLVRAGDARDLPVIAAIGRVRASGYRLRLDRDADAIEYAIAKKRLLAGLGAPGVREVQFFVAEEGASAAAYVVLTVHRHEWTLEELGDRDPAGARAGAILQALMARQPSETRPVVRGRLPAGFLPPQIAIVKTRPTFDVMMIRPLNEAARPSPPLTEAEVLYWQSDVF